MRQLSSPVSVLPPTFEQHHNGFGIQCARPRISWRFECSCDRVHHWRQSSYEIQISDEHGEFPQVFKFEGADNVLVPWPSPEALDSRSRHLVRVRCYGNYHLSSEQVHTSVTEWSAWSPLEIALLGTSDWTGRMITVSERWPLNPDRSARPLCFSKSFDSPLNREAIHKARLYITSHGVYTARINGKKVGDHCLSPGLQSYRKRLHYQIHDVRELLVTSGPNKIEIEVAAGWFASAWSWANNRFIYGEKLGVLAQLEIWGSDLPVPFVASTDQSWSVSTSAVLSSEIYDGEIYDQRVKTDPSLSNATACFSAQESPIPVTQLISPDAPPVRVVNRIEPANIIKSPSTNAVIVDFGQNLAGRICVKRIQKPAGSAITFRHAEVIQDDEIVQRPLRTAKARDILICDGHETIDWHPSYTYHGFRYVEITGWSLEDHPCPLTRSSIVAEVLHTDMPRTGWFSCSNGEVNRLHENSLWSMKSNFLSVPTECPSRDERMGWTGDLNMFAPTANFFMLQYLEHGVTRGKDGLWDPQQWQFGDWLDPRAPQDDSGRGTTDGTFVADCFLVASTRIAANVAGLLSKPADSSRLQGSALHLVQSWRNKYLTPAGLVSLDTATALSLALSFDLLPGTGHSCLKRQSAARLSRIVRLNDFKITTGFVGTAFLSHALSRSGSVDLAYAMLFQKGCPSYLYPVTMGATTSWERWDSMLPNGSVNSGSMTSFNHHALGSISHWLHTDVAGLEPIEPGWKTFRVKPRPNKELTWVETIFESKYGRIELRWTLEGERFCLSLRVPPNSSAVIIMPSDDEGYARDRGNGEERKVGSGQYILECHCVQKHWPPTAILPPWGRAKF
ncbi:glycoside hydrolase family 78 protein [Penicillium hispanicum]|uniref:glycoside hydrolase family 78 protein n=1 Tax=Penicillium hispanicum TaxID=1080232 RepID=UPI0025405FA0|nr:glycoside hydrolase family 78 protein [Penicillium hispanicum]KAJ5570172.1 glycoside hydrolase family 78 protein [Penicillium hispanicum]